MEAAVEIVKTLYAKYADDKFLYDKLNSYIHTLLPQLLENARQTHIQRMARNETIANDQEHFVRKFLESNKYLYSASSDKYFLYDGYHYDSRSEDDVIHHILRTITEFGNSNISWTSCKQKTKSQVMKRIREAQLLKSVPNSDTIQYVLDAFSHIFKTSAEAKYFLTILGDCVLKKKSSLIHMISPDAKAFIRNLNACCQLVIGQVCTSTFKFKYHDQHEYANVRILHPNSVVKLDAVCSPIYSHFVDVICVASYYSTRYESSDNYLFQTTAPFKEDALYLKNNDSDSIVSDFVRSYMSEAPAKSTIPWKNMMFLWKHYLESKNLPSIMLHTTFQAKMRSSPFYNAEQDIFIGITSDKLPIVRKFLDFWEEIVRASPTEYEVEELGKLYKKWSGSEIPEDQLLAMIQHFYPDLIDTNKYIVHIRNDNVNDEIAV